MSAVLLGAAGMLAGLTIVAVCGARKLARTTDRIILRMDDDGEIRFGRLMGITR
jgi:hypothetical protein